MLAAAGSAAVFVLNAVLSLLAFVQILRWKSEPRVSALPGERFVGAMRVGVQHVAQNPRMRAVLLRVFVFFLSTALTALMPLVARQLGGGAGSFTLLMSCMGLGAMVAVMVIPSLRDRYSCDLIVRVGSLVVSAMTLLVALSPWLWLSALGMALGDSAAGAVVWGQVADLVGSVPHSLMAAAACGPVVLYLVRGFTVAGGGDADLRPASPSQTPHPAIEIGPDEGPVMVTVEYLIDPAKARDFAAVMQHTRRGTARFLVVSDWLVGFLPQIHHSD